MSAKGAPARGAYLVDVSTAQTAPPEPAWVGRVQAPLAGGRVLLVTATGYEWPAPLSALRAARRDECDRYEAARRAWLRPSIPGARP